MRKHKKKIRVWFKDGKVDIIPRKLWDDYEVNGNLFAVKKKGAWIGIYNLDVVACVTVG